MGFATQVDIMRQSDAIADSCDDSTYVVQNLPNTLTVPYDFTLDKAGAVLTAGIIDVKMC